jgi:1-aminocyclopropane-1-carboxylate deaminase/D-cysteine desulfhydrase-like pyridoxal-dependent ACC family enzyme
MLAPLVEVDSVIAVPEATAPAAGYAVGLATAGVPVGLATVSVVSSMGHPVTNRLVIMAAITAITLIFMIMLLFVWYIKNGHSPYGNSRFFQ